MNNFRFSNKSLEKLKDVHPDLVKVVKLALRLSEIDFSVNQGLRTYAEQVQNVKKGVSQTLKSKHLVQSTGYSHAVDLIPYPVSWELGKFYLIAEAMRKASKQLNINVIWGGAWVTLNDTEKPCYELCMDYSKARKRLGKKVFIDAPHFELKIK